MMNCMEYVEVEMEALSNQKKIEKLLTKLAKENAKLKERCEVLEGKVESLTIENKRLKQDRREALNPSARKLQEKISELETELMVYKIADLF